MAASQPAAQEPSIHTQRPPIWRDAGVLKWLSQVVVLFLVAGVFWFFASEAGRNLEVRGITVGFDWLDGPANFQISEGIDTVPSSAGRALWVGMVNTLRVAGVGIVASTVIGLIVGLSRLSQNWLASKAASVYIETLRNIPVLVQILLWFAILSSFEQLSDESGPITGWVYVSQKGMSIPRVFWADGFYQWLAFIAIGGVIAWVVRRKLVAKQDTVGGNQRPALIPSLILLAFAVVGWFVNPVMAWLGPVFQAVADGWGALPQPLVQVVLSMLAVAASANWVRRFLNSRRTPAGLAKLSDDDYFRMIFAGVAAILAVVVVWVVWPGLSSWIINSGRDFWEVAANKFGDGRGSRPIDAMRPTLSTGRFSNYGPTGLTFTVFFSSLLIGLTLYTSSFIAEIIRGGVLAVPKGQNEAASALGLSRAQALRHVVLPQAFRVVMPPLGNQYLNITKNTSLGIAVAFGEVVQVGQTAYNKNNETLAVFAIWMVFFLTCSLTISAIVNYINGRLAIVER